VHHIPYKSRMIVSALFYTLWIGVRHKYYSHVRLDAKFALIILESIIIHVCLPLTPVYLVQDVLAKKTPA
jgi:hypothetical protein